MPRGGMLLLINIVALRRARLVLGWVTPIAGDPTDLCYGYVMVPGSSISPISLGAYTHTLLVITA